MKNIFFGLFIFAFEHWKLHCKERDGEHYLRDCMGNNRHFFLLKRNARQHKHAKKK